MIHPRSSNPVLSAACLCLLLAGCGGFEPSKLMPGSKAKEQDLTRAPQGSVAYQCDGGKRLFIRNLDSNAVWVMLNEREFRLEKAAAPAPAATSAPAPATAPVRYSNGTTTLEFKGADAALTEGNTISYANCKQQAAR